MNSVKPWQSKRVWTLTVTSIFNIVAAFVPKIAEVVPVSVVNIALGTFFTIFSLITKDKIILGE